MNRKEQMREACQLFHDTHQNVWHLFVSFAMQKYNRGFKHYGAKAVMERVRWETDAGNPIAPGLDFKLNNNHTAFYAARFNKMYPEISDGNFFRTRKAKVNRGVHPVTTLEGR
jgi:hypothetical protein